MYSNFEIGICWGTLQGANLSQLIDAAGRHGFPTLSTQPAAISEALANLGERRLRQMLADAGVRVRVIDALSDGLPGIPDPRASSSAPRGLPPLSREMVFQAAEAVEAPIVNVTHYGGGPASHSAMVDALGSICLDAERRGLRIVLEFIPDTAIPSIDVAHALASEVAAKNCSVLLDTWHLARSGGTLDNVRRLPPGMIGAVQLSDRTPPPPGTPYVPMTGRLLPGEGELPLPDLVRAALANNPGVTAELEVFSEELRNLGTEGAAARAATAVKAWRAGLDPAGDDIGPGVRPR